MKRTIEHLATGFPAIDGAGVKLVRVLGRDTYKDFNPILMLDSFDSKNRDDFKAGFPMHPHRGIETISYIYKGRMRHRDSLGNEDEISGGEVQWMCAGSGIMHEEFMPNSEEILGVQLWLNLPKELKMTNPTYNAIKNSDIKEFEIDGGKVRLLSGEFRGEKGFQSKNLPLDYYDIHLEKGKTFSLGVKENASIMLFTLKGEIKIDSQNIGEKTAVKLSSGGKVGFEALSDTQVLFISSTKLNESMAWAGPIVMNSNAELKEAFDELHSGTFIKESLDIK